MLVLQAQSGMVFENWHSVRTRHQSTKSGPVDCARVTSRRPEELGCRDPAPKPSLPKPGKLEDRRCGRRGRLKVLGLANGCLFGLSFFDIQSVEWDPVVFE